MSEWAWNGARWWRFDFHAHTPASRDFGQGANQQAELSVSPRDWLLAFMNAQIDCVAVTDHNTGEWIDRLNDALSCLQRDKPTDYRELVLFPGVEITVHSGVHVLAILAPGKSTTDITSLLGTIHYRGKQGKSEDCTEATFTEVVNEIGMAGGVAIPAHVDSARGLFTEQHGTTLQQSLRCGKVQAMELQDAAHALPQLYLDSGRRWVRVLGSDTHHVLSTKSSVPGSGYTWVKMGSPDLEGLRLALLDGQLSVRCSDMQTTNPNVHGDMLIEEIQVTHARYMGRSSTFCIRLSPWLNAIIGGRGTGKSTCVEFVRRVLQRQDELPLALASDFAKYAEVYKSRDDEGLLTNDACFAVTYRKDGARFRVTWTQADNTQTIEMEDSDGNWAAAEGDIAQRFPVRIYSQKQVFELAKDPLALLRIVDQAPEVAKREWQDQWAEEEARYLSLQAQAREIETGLADEPRLRGELEDVKRRMSVFEGAGHADILKEYQQRTRQQRQVGQWEEKWANSPAQLTALAAELVPDPLAELLIDTVGNDGQDILGIAVAARERLQSIAEMLKNLAEQIQAAFGDWERSRDASSWQKAVTAALDAYEELRQRLASEGVGDPSEYGTLVQQRQAIEERLAVLQERRTQLSQCRESATESVERLIDLRREITRRRQSFLAQEALESKPFVRVAVEPYGAKDTVESGLRRILQREEGFNRAIGSVEGEGLIGGLYASSGDGNVGENEIAELKAKLRSLASGGSDAGEVRDQRFISHLSKLPPEAFDRLDLWFPEDSLRVQYSTADGSEFRSILEGSPGQKTAALLAFLLSYGTEPIVLDQPEDDLDNNFIYELIVAQLRRMKPRRQILVVTHNANIVVNGDAEYVVALAARAGETKIVCSGCLQERKVRDTICKVMEGGKIAFDERYRRIAL